MSDKTLTGAELEKALKSGALDESNLTVTGMVKQSDQDDHIAFALGGCDTWIDVPTSMIDTAEVAGQRACRDHHHPLVSITLKESGDPMAKVLAGLLAARTEAAAHGPDPTFATVAHMGEIFATRRMNPAGRRPGDFGGRLGFSCNPLFCACRGDADCNDMFTTNLCSGRSICIDDYCYCIR